MKCIHHLDLDGHSAGAVVAFATQNYNPDDFFEWDYNAPIPVDTFATGEKIYIVDCSFSETTVHYLESMMEKDCSVVLIDHHKTTLDLQELPQYAWVKRLGGLRSNRRSGVYLAWQYFYPDLPVPRFIQLISDFDAWTQELLPESDYFKLAMDMKDQTPTGDYFKLLFNSEDDCTEIESCIAIGKVIKQYIDIDNIQYRDDWSFESRIDGHKALVVNKRSGSWIFGDRYNDYPVCCTFVFDGLNYSYSVYSSHDDVDCSAIAKKFGGGGHRGAAGFVSDKLLFGKVVD